MNVVVVWRGQNMVTKLRSQWPIEWGGFLNVWIFGKIQTISQAPTKMEFDYLSRTNHDMDILPWNFLSIDDIMKTLKCNVGYELCHFVLRLLLGFCWCSIHQLEYKDHSFCTFLPLLGCNWSQLGITINVLSPSILLSNRSLDSLFPCTKATTKSPWEAHGCCPSNVRRHGELPF